METRNTDREAEAPTKELTFLVVSDLHLDFHEDRGEGLIDSLGEADVLVIAGDLCQHQTFRSALDRLCAKYPQILYVPGNHEYYTSSFHEVRAQLKRSARKRPNLHILDRAVFALPGFKARVLGCTLWFPELPDNYKYNWRLNDFTYIKNFGALVYKEHALDKRFLEDNVQAGDIVVTHHLPTHAVVHPKYLMDSDSRAMNRYFVSDMHEFILDRAPLLWLCGHTHVPNEVQVGSTSVILNPLGYPEERVNFNTNRKIVLQETRA